MTPSRRSMHRGTGALVLGMALTAAVVVAVGLLLGDPHLKQPIEQHVVLGVWTLLYSTEAPSVQVLVVAVGVALFVAAAVAAADRHIANRYRRSSDVTATPLAPKVVMAATAGRYDGEVTVTVLIPAHNEADRIGATLWSLWAQETPPERVVVVADNCTDDTEDIARAHGAEVLSTVGNRHKKAGALNQALDLILPTLGPNDTVLVMDADTVLSTTYLAAVRRRMTDDRALMAIGGLFLGEEGSGLLGQMQRNEYTRYRRDIARRRGRLYVLTGTASVFRSAALREVARHRGGALPGRPGEVYDTVSLTEDNELTLALKTLGALMISAPQCGVVTEVMPTWQALWAQRLRWQRGALENLGAYGLTAQTARYWAQQMGIGYGVVALSSYALLVLVMALSLDTFVWFPFWMGLGAVFALERVVSVWSGGWRARLLGASLLPELLYACVLNAVYVRGVWDLLLDRRAEWKHVVTGTDGRVRVEDGELV